MNELVAKRTLNGKVFDLGNGQRQHDFHVEPIHYDAGKQALEEIDASLEDGGDFLVSRATPYSLTIAKSVKALEAPFLFGFDGISLGFIPRGLRLDNQEVVFQDASGSADFEGKFGGAYGQYGDLLVQPSNSGVGKVIKILGLPAIPNGVQHLEAGFELVAPEGFELWYQDSANQPAVDVIRAQLKTLDAQRLVLEKERKDYVGARAIHKQQKELENQLHDAMLSKWDKLTDTAFTGKWQIRVNGKKIYGRALQVWDSKAGRQRLEAQLRLRNGKFYLAKLIPVSFLRGAAFPVFTDATTSYYAGAGDGYILNQDSTWAAARGAVSGDNAFATTGANGLNAQTASFVTPRYDVYRTFIPTDTSAIDDAASITACDVKVYVKSKLADEAISIHAVETSQASTATLDVADFDALSFTDGGSQAMTGMSVNTYTTIPLNATGLTWISKTGTSKIGLITSQDQSNTSPGAATKENGIIADASEATGTSTDPYLSITVLDSVAASRRSVITT